MGVQNQGKGTRTAMFIEVAEGGWSFLLIYGLEKRRTRGTTSTPGKPVPTCSKSRDPEEKTICQKGVRLH